MCAGDFSNQREAPLSSGRMARLQVLEVAAVPLVRGSEIRLVEHPMAVRRHAVLRGERDAAKRRRGDAHALLRELRAHRVHGPESRHEQVDAREPGIRLGDARIGVVRRGLRRWHRRVDLPRERHARLGVLREQVVEDRGTGARLADDHDRWDDRDVDDLGVLGSPRDHAQAAREQGHDLVFRDGHAELVEAGFLAERVQQPIEALEIRVVAELAESGRRLRALDQLRAAGQPVAHRTAGGIMRRRWHALRRGAARCRRGTGPSRRRRAGAPALRPTSAASGTRARRCPRSPGRGTRRCS